MENITELTGFDSFVCSSPRWPIYILVAIFMLITIISQILAKKKGVFAAHISIFICSLLGNIIWGISIDVAYCLSVKYTITDLVLIIACPTSYFLFSLTMLLCRDICLPKDGMERIHRIFAYCEIKDDEIYDDRIVNINAYINRAYTDPPVITITGRMRPSYEYTSAAEIGFQDVLPYSSWVSTSNMQIHEDFSFSVLNLICDFQLSEGLQEQLNQKINHIREISAENGYDIIDININYDIPLRTTVINYVNSKVYKFARSWGLGIAIFANMFGFLALQENIYGLSGKIFNIHVKKTISDNDDLPGKYLKFDRHLGLGDDAQEPNINLPQQSSRMKKRQQIDEKSNIPENFKPVNATELPLNDISNIQHHSLSPYIDD